MAKTIEILEYLKEYPVFDTLTLSNKLKKSNNYINLFLHRLKKAGHIFHIEKNKYTLFNDAFLIASRIVWPCYISCWSSLKYHNLTEQVPHDIWVITTKYKKDLTFNNTKIRFIKIKVENFFGFEKVKYNNFEIMIANPEKSIIDSALLRKISSPEIIDIFSSNIKNLRIYEFISYLKRIKNKSLIKRFGYLLDILRYDYYNKLKNYVDATYVKLDYSKKATDKKDNKWRIIINA